jgi:hypothetical protein
VHTILVTGARENVKTVGARVRGNESALTRRGMKRNEEMCGLGLGEPVVENNRTR